MPYFNGFRDSIDMQDSKKDAVIFEQEADVPSNRNIFLAYQKGEFRFVIRWQGGYDKGV